MGKKRLTTEEFIQRAKEIHGDKFDYSEVESVYPRRTHIKIFCKKHNGFFLQRPENHLFGYGCKICWQKEENLNLTNKEHFIKRMFNKYGENLFDLTNINYINSSTKVNVFCKIHNKYNTQRPQDLLSCRQKSCICNKTNVRKTSEERIIELKNIYGDKFDYSKVEYKNKLEKIILICTKCGKENLRTTRQFRTGHGCTHCAKSKGETIIEDYFISKNIPFKGQHSFKDCKRKGVLFFDFYLEQFNLCIEFDGIQHFSYKKWFAHNNKSDNKAQFKLLKERDEIKNTYCLKNNINLLRINYKEINNIPDILEKYLKQLLLKRLIYCLTQNL